MLPPASSFLLGIEFYFRRRRMKAQLDITAITSALADAQRLAAGVERHEPTSRLVPIGPPR